MQFRNVSFDVNLIAQSSKKPFAKTRWERASSTVVNGVDCRVDVQRGMW